MGDRTITVRVVNQGTTGAGGAVGAPAGPGPAGPVPLTPAGASGAFVAGSPSVTRSSSYESDQYGSGGGYGSGRDRMAEIDRQFRQREREMERRHAAEQKARDAYWDSIDAARDEAKQIQGNMFIRGGVGAAVLGGKMMDQRARNQTEQWNPMTRNRFAAEDFAWNMVHYIPGSGAARSALTNVNYRNILAQRGQMSNELGGDVNQIALIRQQTGYQQRQIITDSMLQREGANAAIGEHEALASQKDWTGLTRGIPQIGKRSEQTGELQRELVAAQGRLPAAHRGVLIAQQEATKSQQELKDMEAERTGLEARRARLQNFANTLPIGGVKRAGVEGVVIENPHLAIPQMIQDIDRQLAGGEGRFKAAQNNAREMAARAKAQEDNLANEDLHINQRRLAVKKDLLNINRHEEQVAQAGIHSWALSMPGERQALFDAVMTIEKNGMENTPVEMRRRAFGNPMTAEWSARKAEGMPEDPMMKQIKQVVGVGNLGDVRQQGAGLEKEIALMEKRITAENQKRLADINTKFAEQHAKELGMLADTIVANVRNERIKQQREQKERNEAGK